MSQRSTNYRALRGSLGAFECNYIRPHRRTSISLVLRDEITQFTLNAKYIFHSAPVKSLYNKKNYKCGFNVYGFGLLFWNRIMLQG